MNPLLYATTLAAALGCALVGGVFFAFSSFVMAGLGRLPPAHGAAAMQQINVTAVRPAFMTAFFGTAALCLALVVVSIVGWGDRRAWLLLVGSALYLVGSILVTVARNVPLNDALAAVDAASAEGATVWADYLRTWTAWNTVRTIASLAAAGLLIGAQVI